MVLNIWHDKFKYKFINFNQKRIIILNNMKNMIALRAIWIKFKVNSSVLIEVIVSIAISSVRINAFLNRIDWSTCFLKMKKVLQSICKIIRNINDCGHRDHDLHDCRDHGYGLRDHDCDRDYGHHGYLHDHDRDH